MKSSYNHRLFNNPFRRKIHLARFYWLKRVIQIYCPNYLSIFEFGCNDSKSLLFLPYLPLKYLGLDADWEGGLNIAKKKYKAIEDYKFLKTKNIKDFPILKSKFDLVICLETLEHLPPHDLERYLLNLSSLMKGYFIITVRNEIGFIFLIKYLFKILFNLDPDNYSTLEIYYQFIGKVEEVKRTNHKGFSWLELVKILEMHFEIVKIEGIPFSYLPKFLNFGIGIILKNKN